MAESNILPFIVGAINDRENVIKANLKCVEEKEASDPLSDLEVSVLFPKKTDDVVPLIGGSIVKIKLGTKVGGEENFSSIIQSFSKKFKGLQAFIQDDISAKEFSLQSTSDQVKLHVAINKFFETSPFLQRNLYEHNVPTITLSNVFTDQDSADKINKEIKDKAKKGARLSRLAEVGPMKFIPIEVIASIYKTIAPDEETGGFYENVGLSGVSFGQTRSAIEGYTTLGETPADDEIVAKAILDIFPFFRIDERFIEGKRSVKNVGFYTVSGDSVYIKMPDLSGRDASSDSSNLYGLGEDDVDFNYGYLFELYLNRQYSAVAFDYKAPPVIEVADNLISLSGNDAGKLEIDSEGFDSSTKFFLSPIIKNSTLKADGMVAVKSISDGNEAFTVPNLSVPFYDANSSPVLNDAIDPGRITSNLESIFPERENSEWSLAEYENGIKLFVPKQNAFYYFDANNFGKPLSGNPGFVNNGSEFLGLINRPDIVLGRRDSKSTHKRNNRKFFADKIYASKELMGSVTPSIITAEQVQIPKIFVKGKISGGFISFEKTTSLSGVGLDYFDGNITGEDYVEFALYAMDDLGQITRCPGQNIRLTPKDQSILRLSRNGFKESGVTLQLQDPVERLELSVDSIDDLSSIKIYDSKFDGQELGELGSGDYDYVLAGSTLTIILNDPETTWQDLIGAITGVVWFELNGDSGPDRVPFYITPEGAESIETPPEPVQFKRLEGLSAPRFSGSVDSIPVLLDKTTNAKIDLKYYKRVFKENSVAYAYFAFHENNRDILSDVGFIGDEEEIKEVTIGGGNYLLACGGDFQSGYKLGGANFKRLSGKKVSLNFPGPFSTKNISRFSKIVGTEEEYAGYIIITNYEISGGKVTLDEENKSMTKIPIGPRPGSGESVDAFSDPPHIVGIAAKLSESEDSYVTNYSGINEFDSELRGIKTQNIQVGPIVAADSLTRLSLVFKGSHSDRRKGKSYSAYMGTKRLKSFRTTTVRESANKDGFLVLNYKNIDSIRDSGWTNISIRKKDRRFGITYDSTVYNASTINLTSTSDDSALDHFFEVKDGSRRLKEELRVVDNSVIEPADEAATFTHSESSAIFPFGGDQNSGIPYSKKGVGVVEPAIPSGIKNVNSSYFVFQNPIKMYPQFDLSIGKSFGKSESGIYKDYGILLTDTDISKRPYGEVSELSPNGRMEVIPNLEELGSIKDSLGQKLSESKEALAGEIGEINSSIEKLEATGDNPTELERLKAEKAEKEAQAEELNSAQQELDSTYADAEAADQAAKDAAEAEAAEQARGGADGGGDEGALDEAADAVEAAGEALDEAAQAVEDAAAAAEAAVAAAQALLDALSRIAMLVEDYIEDLESELSSYGIREADFYAINIANIFISKKASIGSGLTESAKDNKNAKLVMFSRFEQSAAIKFNVPEIIYIKKSGDQKEYLPIEFGEISVESGTELVLRTIGTNEDTKTEINKVRVTNTIIKEEGIFKDLSIVIDSLKKYTFLDNCIEVALTNDNENRLRLKRQLGNDLAINLDDRWPENIFGGRRNKQGPPGELRQKIKDNYLKFTAVTLDGIGAAKEFMQSFCDLSFHLTAELSLQLRNFKVLLIPIKVILCIIDVICALLHPIRLAFAIVRLFLCLYDLILLLPQLSVPAMLLSLLLHIIELLLCVIIKVLNIINAINEIIDAFQVAIDQKDYPAIVALEETINEHLFTLEADLHVLEPILEIIALFLELLQLVFAFPCQVGSDEDDEACIDPSQLAGIILSKVAPRGKIEPDALLPLAQTYTKLSLGEVGSKGNTPEESIDDGSYVTDSGGGTIGSAILVEARESSGKIVVSNNSSYGGNDLTGLTDSQTGEPKQIEDGGFFSGDLDEDGKLDNVNYQTLRMGDNANDEEPGSGESRFNATFGISFTKSKKEFKIFTGPDPRIVKIEFNERGLTNSLAFNWFLQIFFKKKNIDNIQALDAPPGWVIPDGNSLKVNSGSVGGLTSPVDGASDIDENGNFKGFFLRKIGSTYQPRQLEAFVPVTEFELNEETQEYEETVDLKPQRFPNIPMIAFVDDEFNVYFVDETENGGGIEVENDGGVEVIKSISLKMINYPTAPKKKFSKETREVYRPYVEINPKSDRGEGIGTGGGLTLTHIDYEVDPDVVKTNFKEKETDDANLGQIMIYEQANANWLIGSLTADEHEDYFSDPGTDDEVFRTVKFNKHFGEFTAGYVYSNLAEISASPVDVGDLAPGSVNLGEPPFPNYGLYDWANGSKKEQQDFGESIDDIKVFDFPQLYIIDLRHVAADIASACGAGGATDILMKSVNFDIGASDEIADLCENTAKCVNDFRDMFLSEKLDNAGDPIGLVPKMRKQLGAGVVPEKISQADVISKYEGFRSCLEGVVQDTCKFVINPLNTSFKILDDDDETPLADFVNPEQKELANLANIVEEIELDEDLAGFPKITGAMEYASGIGDAVQLKAGEKAVIKIIPRDCYDDVMSPNLDLTDSISIDFVKDDTDGAELVPPDNGTDIFVKNGSEYTFGITAPTPGLVKIKATVCSVVISAVTDAGIDFGDSTEVEVDCVDDITEPDEEQGFAPGQLIKVDRILSLIFTKNNRSSSNYGDSDRDKNEKSAIPSPQTFGTNLEN